MLTPKKSAIVLTVLAVVLCLSLFVHLYQPELGSPQPINVLDVSISGPEKIPYNAPTTYTASVEGSYFRELTYIWTISPDNDSKTKLEQNGKDCTLTFTQPTTDPYLLKVEVRDEAHGFGVGTKTVVDPPTYPNLYLGAYGAPYSYMVCVDQSGAYYYAINGSTGRVEWSSTDAASVISNATYNGKSVVLNDMGEVSLTSPIYIYHNGTSITSPNVNGTVLKAASGFTLGGLILANNINDNLYWISITNLNLDGNKAAVTNTTMDGIRLKCGLSFIEYNYIHDFKRNGMFISTTGVIPPPGEPDNNINSNHLYNCGSYGAYLSCTDQHFSRNDIYYNNIGVYAGTSAVMSDNHAYSNTASGYEVGEGSVLMNCESETGVTSPTMGQLYGFAINACPTKPVSLIGCWGFNMKQLVRFNGNVGNFLMVGCRSMNPSEYAVYVPTSVTVTNMTITGCMFHTGSNGAQYNINNGGTIVNLCVTGTAFNGKPFYNSGAPITGIATHLTGVGNIGCTTEYIGSASNATATTWTFTPDMLSAGANAPSPTMVEISFNSTVTGAYWGYSGTTLTITGTPTDAATTCYIKAIYQT